MNKALLIPLMALLLVPFSFATEVPYGDFVDKGYTYEVECFEEHTDVGQNPIDDCHAGENPYMSADAVDGNAALCHWDLPGSSGYNNSCDDFGNFGLKTYRNRAFLEDDGSKTVMRINFTEGGNHVSPGVIFYFYTSNSSLGSGGAAEVDAAFVMSVHTDKPNMSAYCSLANCSIRGGDDGACYFRYPNGTAIHFTQTHMQYHKFEWVHDFTNQLSEFYLDDTAWPECDIFWRSDPQMGLIHNITGFGMDTQATDYLGYKGVVWTWDYWNMEAASAQSADPNPPQGEYGLCPEQFEGCLFYDDFSYTSSLIENFWQVAPLGTDFTPLNGVVFLTDPGSWGSSIFHAWIEEGYPIITAEWNMALHNVSTDVPGEVPQIIGGSLKREIPERPGQTALFETFHLLFLNQSGSYNINYLYAEKDGNQVRIDQTAQLCANCWTPGQSHTYKIYQVYIPDSTLQWYDNVSGDWSQAEQYTMAFEIDGLIVEDGIKMNRVFYDDDVNVHFDNIYFITGKYQESNIELDYVYVYKGIDLETDLTQNLTTPIAESDVESHLGGLFKTNETGGFWDCSLMPDCCTAKEGVTKVTDIWCVFSKVFGQYFKKLANWMVNHIFYMIILLIILFAYILLRKSE